MEQLKRPTLPTLPSIEAPEPFSPHSIEPLVDALRLAAITEIQRGSLLAPSKSIVQSKTVLSIIFGLIIGASTIFSPAVIERKPINRGDVYAFVALLLTSVGGIVGRYAAKQPLNTPKGLPGRDPN